MEVTKTELLRDTAKYFDEVEKTGSTLKVIKGGGRGFRSACDQNEDRKKRMMKEVQAWYESGIDGDGAETSEEELFQPMTDDWEVLKEDARNP